MVGHQSTYEVGLRRAVAERHGDGPMLVLLLGSNLGQLRHARRRQRSCSASAAAVAPGDLLLLGADLVKREADLLLAYDDPLGVTAAFNKNLLVRINRELGGNFDLDAFAHRAVWNASSSGSRCTWSAWPARRCASPLADTTVHFAHGETIWTESSYKYTPDQIRRHGRRRQARDPRSVDRRRGALRAHAVRREVTPRAVAGFLQVPISWCY